MYSLAEDGKPADNMCTRQLSLIASPTVSFVDKELHLQALAALKTIDRHPLRSAGKSNVPELN